MLLYHGSPVAGITLLKPHVSNHDRPLLYLTAKRENAVVYLSNAVEKYHRDHRIPHTGGFLKAKFAFL